MGTILQLRDVTVSFDGFPALDGLDFSLDETELRFVIGPNGAGKTTMLDVITGKVRPKTGSLLFDARTELRGMNEHERVQLGIGRKFQTPTVFPALTVFENLEVTLACRSGTRAFFRKLRSDEADRIEATLTTVGLSHRARRRAGSLSHGETQWLEIGMLLVQDPKLLLLDEPIAGMTRQERDRTGEILSSLTGHSIVVVEHDMEFMRQFARRVTVMHLGKVLCEGSVADVQDDPRVQEIYLGPQRQAVAA